MRSVNLYFGLRWGPSSFDPSLMTVTPVGEPCLHCGEPVEDGDSGLITQVVSETSCEIRAQHRECFLRQLVGSVGHLEGKCSCYGGDQEDPPGISLRQAAIQAVRMSGLRL